MALDIVHSFFSQLEIVLRRHWKDWKRRFMDGWVSICCKEFVDAYFICLQWSTWCNFVYEELSEYISFVNECQVILFLSYEMWCIPHCPVHSCPFNKVNFFVKSYRLLIVISQTSLPSFEGIRPFIVFDACWGKGYSKTSCSCACPSLFTRWPKDDIYW